MEKPQKLERKSVIEEGNSNPECAGTELEIAREIGGEGRRTRMLVLSTVPGKWDCRKCWDRTEYAESSQVVLLRRFWRTVAHPMDQGIGQGGGTG